MKYEFDRGDNIHFFLLLMKKHKNFKTEEEMGGSLVTAHSCTKWMSYSKSGSRE